MYVSAAAAAVVEVVEDKEIQNNETRTEPRVYANNKWYIIDVEQKAIMAAY